MKVRIVSCSKGMWYKFCIGQIVIVSDIFADSYYYLPLDDFILKSDCEVIN